MEMSLLCGFVDLLPGNICSAVKIQSNQICKKEAPEASQPVTYNSFPIY